MANTREPETQKNAAIALQKNIRGFLSRESFFVPSLAPEIATDYPTFMVGCDPVMGDALKPYIEPKEKIALIATSGLRCLSLALKLGASTQLPKIFLIDNSHCVISFWKNLKRFMGDDALCKNENEFYSNLLNFLKDNSAHINWLEVDEFKKEEEKNLKYLSQDLPVYFMTLFKNYTYDRVRSAILHVTPICQDWSNPALFSQLKLILNYLSIAKVYVYASNIVPYSFMTADDPDNSRKILKNIEQLNFDLAIHTDLQIAKDGKGYLPKKFFLFSGEEKEKIETALLGKYSVKSVNNLILNEKKEEDEKQITLKN